MKPKHRYNSAKINYLALKQKNMASCTPFSGRKPVLYYFAVMPLTKQAESILPNLNVFSSPPFLLPLKHIGI